jgi:excisionase family DNA binding protein
MDDKRSLATHDKLAYRPVEVAERLDVSRAHIYRLIQRGQISVVTLGGRWMVLAEELDRFIERVKAGEAA